MEHLLLVFFQALRFFTQLLASVLHIFCALFFHSTVFSWLKISVDNSLFNSYYYFKMAKSLKIVFYVLLALVIFEVSYFLFLKYKNLPQKTNTGDKPVNVRYLENEIIPLLTDKKRVESQKLILIREITGNITKIEYKSKNQILTIEIRDNRGNEISLSDTPYREDNPPRFFKIDKGKETILSFNDFKVGDEIKIISHIDLKSLEKSYKEYTLL